MTSPVGSTYIVKGRNDHMLFKGRASVVDVGPRHYNNTRSLSRVIVEGRVLWNNAYKTKSSNCETKHIRQKTVVVKQRTPMLQKAVTVKQPSKCKTFEYHLYNIGPTSKMLGRRCIKAIQMFCAGTHIRQKQQLLNNACTTKSSNWILENKAVKPFSARTVFIRHNLT